MKPKCPHCFVNEKSSGSGRSIVRHGHFFRQFDKRLIVRFRCLDCQRSFSSETTHCFFRQKKRDIHAPIFSLLASGISQRRLALILKVNRKTVVRKFLLLGRLSSLAFREFNLQCPPSAFVQFDELETIEHSKCKPLSVPLAVDTETRRILAFSVARMPAKGMLAKIARKKYGPRADERNNERKKVLNDLRTLTLEKMLIKTDEHPAYPILIRLILPKVRHETIKGQRGSLGGQGELKKIGFDPLFSLNHTCAMLRANINRLIRKTWCTTKLKERLELHLAIYALYHNAVLLNK
jgi:transposase-like protein